MKKKHFIFIFFLCFIIFTIFYFFAKPNEGEIIHSTDADSRYKNEPDSKPIPENTEIITECFSVLNMQNIASVKQEVTKDQCVIRAMLLEPIGQITVSHEKPNESKKITQITDHTGVSLRTNDAGKYTKIEKIEAVPQPHILTATDEYEAQVFTTNTEITGFFLNKKTNAITVFSIHSVAKITESVVSDFWKLVASTSTNSL